MPFGITKVQSVDDHADISGIFPRLSKVRDLDQFESRLVQIALEFFVPVEIAVGLFNHDMTLEKESFEDFLNIEPRKVGVPSPECDILQVQKDSHGRFGITCTHCKKQSTHH